jgi:hypothetical protein
MVLAIRIQTKSAEGFALPNYVPVVAGLAFLLLK